MVSVDEVVKGLAGDGYFVVVCPAEAGEACGTDQRYLAVTAPIWLRAPGVR